jgi:hypothetical protein
MSLRWIINHTFASIASLDAIDSDNSVVEGGNA